MNLLDLKKFNKKQSLSVWENTLKNKFSRLKVVTIVNGFIRFNEFIMSFFTMFVAVAVKAAITGLGENKEINFEILV